ncbi:MAG: protein TolR [Boseongicola sp. SB0662_bin_57]|nr:protein TolR [Boseongicola sp. SB0662_bin_57]
MGVEVVQAERTGKRRRRRRARPMSEINVTPFVDVMLVLLIIFMVAAPLQTVGVPVELPRTAAQTLASGQEEPLTVTLTADGVTMIQTTEVADEEIVPRLRAVLSERASRRVYVRADGAIPYARVVQVMGALNAAGITDIGLVTDMGGPRLGGG